MCNLRVVEMSENRRIGKLIEIKMSSGGWIHVRVNRGRMWVLWLIERKHLVFHMWGEDAMPTTQLEKMMVHGAFTWEPLIKASTLRRRVKKYYWMFNDPLAWGHNILKIPRR
jgi:hypothetical protein